MRRSPWKIIVALVIVLAGAAVLYQLFRPLPILNPVASNPAPPKTQAISLPWPAAGQAAVGASDYGVLATHSDGRPLPTASVAKVITALAVLQKKPLAAGQQGPVITLDATDLDYFNYYYKNDGSVTKVAAGEEITQYQALQALLIPSSNNMGDSLARWAFGSPATYITYANAMIKQMGLTNTVVGNTNGFDDTTTSTAEDLVKLGLQAVKNPVIADITSQESAVIPVQGQIKNTNWLLGANGVVGIKTGNTDKAGGCYLVASKQIVQGKEMTVISAVLGAPTLADAINGAKNLIIAAPSGFEHLTVVSKNQSLGSYTAPWGASAQLNTGKDLTLLVWKGADIKIVSKLEPVKAPQPEGAAAGSVKVQSSGQSAGSALYLTQALPGPSLSWRLTR